MFREWKISTMDRVRNAIVVPSGLLTNSPDAAFHIMAHQIGDHDQNGYDKALEEHVKAHASGEDPFLGIPGLLLHDVGFALFHPQSQSREAVGDQG